MEHWIWPLIFFISLIVHVFLIHPLPGSGEGGLSWKKASRECGGPLGGMLKQHLSDKISTFANQEKAPSYMLAKKVLEINPNHGVMKVLLQRVKDLE